MTARRLLALGPAAGWHAERLQRSAERLGHGLVFAPYESLAARIDGRGQVQATCAAGELADFAAVLCRTMPLGSMEQITFRLAVLHGAEAAGVRLVNSPRTLELAIDKYASLRRIAALGYRVPETTVVQSRRQGLAAFEALGGDVVVKPIFGGEGRGVMRVQDRQLAWSCFTTLEQLGAVLYVQRFVPPGGRDTRMLVIGREVFGIRRTSHNDFRTNVAGGAISRAVELTTSQIAMAQRIAGDLSLEIGSIDLLDCSVHGSVVVEVNGVPGWKGAQACLETDLADRMIRCCLEPPAGKSAGRCDRLTQHAAREDLL